MTDTNKVWPIKSETSCYFKWAWSTIYLNRGTTASCHRTVHNEFTVENFDNFHNLPKKLDDRRRMLAGKWPEESETSKFGLSGCTYCKHIEDAGGVSDRLVQLQHFEKNYKTNKNVLPPELIDDASAVAVTPTIVEVYFNNVCNMACLYCGPHFSSMWEEENRRFNAEENGILVNPSWERNAVRYDQMRDKFFAWLRENGHKIWNFGFLGGEPFYQKEFDMVIDHWDKYPNPDLMLTIVTNLKIEHKRFVNYINRLQKLVDEKKIKFLNISCSMDGWGPEMEYQRWGLNLNDWETNFLYLLKFEMIVLNINMTITPLSVKALPGLLERLHKWNNERLIIVTAKNLKIPKNQIENRREEIQKIINENSIPWAIDKWKHITYSFMSVVEPAQLDPKIFGSGVFDEDFKKIINLLPNDTDYEKTQVPYMEGIAKGVAQSKPNVDLIGKLKSYLDEMDRRRGTHWPDVFPWLVEEFKKYKL